MAERSRIAFVWQGISGRYGHDWKDGLWGAMQLIEKEHQVTYHEPTDEIPLDAIILYWEAPCTAVSPKDKQNYLRIRSLPNRKALLFAGGPIKREWLDGFDHVFVESKINAGELEDLGISHSTAFGINEEIFHPMNLEKKWWGIHPGACASWKRQGFVGEALGDKGLVCGRIQPGNIDTFGFDRCKELGTTVLPQQTPEELAVLLNQSHCLLQTSAYWGGGQRATLEALACNIPVVCMSDSPKNREYVEESECGLVVEPELGRIKDGVGIVMKENWGNRGRDYILSKWTQKHYADALLNWLNK